MKTCIKGKNYNFFIVAKGDKFYIEAVHTALLCSSFINNLNPILSEFGIKLNDEKISESQWILPKRSVNLFFEKANKFLLDDNFRIYIEKVLDEDRLLSEWENFKENKGSNAFVFKEQVL